MTQESKNPQPQDGFDLIEYPSDYLFKAMCKTIDGVNVADQIRDLVLTIVTQEALLDVRGNRSRTGKFESVSLSIRLQNREQLEAVYAAIANAPMVVMTL